MADVTTITPKPATKTKPTEPECPPATIPGTQVAILIICAVVAAVAWGDALPLWAWIAAAVILAALAVVWLARARSRSRDAAARRDGRTPAAGRNRDGRRGLFGRKTPAGREAGGRGAAKNTAGNDRKAAAAGGRAAKQAAKAKRAADKAAAKAAKKSAAADRRAAKKAARADKRAAKKAAKKNGGRGAMQSTGRVPAVDIWDRKKKEDKPKKQKDTAARPPKPATPKPIKTSTNRRTITMSDFTQPGAAASLISSQAAELQRFFSQYNPASLAAFSDDLPVTAEAVRQQAKAFGSLAETVGRFKINGAVAEQLKVAEKVLAKVAEAVDETRATLERTEADKLDRQRNGDVEDRRADISRHQGEG